MAGLVPAIHVFAAVPAVKAWMPGTSPGTSPGMMRWFSVTGTCSSGSCWACTTQFIGRVTASITVRR